MRVSVASYCEQCKKIHSGDCALEAEKPESKIPDLRCRCGHLRSEHDIEQPYWCNQGEHYFSQGAPAGDVNACSCESFEIAEKPESADQEIAIEVRVTKRGEELDAEWNEAEAEHENIFTREGFYLETLVRAEDRIKRLEELRESAPSIVEEDAELMEEMATMLESIHKIHGYEDVWTLIEKFRARTK